MSKTILIVDDSASMRQTVYLCLSAAGYEVIQAVDGLDGLSKLDGRRIHLVIADVNMPQLNGIDMVRALRAKPEYRFTPVMMLTTETDETRRQEAQQAGARAWLVKPFRPPQLLAAVSRLIAS